MRGVHSAVDDIRRNVFTEVDGLFFEKSGITIVDGAKHLPICLLYTSRCV